MFESQVKMIASLRKNYADKFMYQQPETPLELIEEITGQLGVSANQSILVLFTVEWALYLQEVGYNNVCVASNGDAVIESLCEKLGLKYQDISEIEKNKMKFDVVVGNPPYNSGVGEKRETAKNTNNSNLYFDFIRKSYGVCPAGTVALIVPAAWMQSSNIKQLIISHGLKSIHQIHPDNFPTVGIRSGISAFCSVYRYSGLIDIISLSEKFSISRSAELSFDDPKKFIIVDKLKEFDSIAARLEYGPYTVPKGSKGSIDRLLSLDTSYSTCSDSRYTTKVMIYSGGSRDPARYLYSLYNQTTSNYGVVVPSASDKHIIGTPRLLYPNEGVSNKLKVMYFSSEEAATNAISYLNSKIIKFVINTTKHNDTVNTNKNSFNNIPIVDFSHAWTDTELYEHFNLTQDEIELIEATVK